MVLVSCLYAVVLICGFLILSGCQQESSTSPAPVGSQTEQPTAGDDASAEVETAGSESEPTADSKSIEIPLQILDWDQTLKLVAEKKGKVVVLDLWSSSCIPCIKEFPKLVELQKIYGDKIACISFNCDYFGLADEPPEFYKESVLKFLTKKEALFDNIISSIESDKLFETIDLASIPAVYVYDIEGKVAKRFDNDSGDDEFTYEKDIIPLVEKLMAQ